MKKPLSLLFGILAFAGNARAADPAAAQALFNQARQLVSDGNYAQACPKFEESQQLDPGIGTLFNLADCLEHLGKTSSAWADFVEVADEARAQGERAREQIARERAAALEPKLSRLTVRVSDKAAVAQPHVTRDGVDVGSGQWGLAVPVDPGEHVIAAEASGKRAWKTNVMVPPGPSTISVEVPELAPDVAQTAPVVQAEASPTPAASTSPGRGRRTLGLVLGGVGIVGLGVGTVFGLLSMSAHDDATQHCDPNTNHCDATGVSLRDTAINTGWASTIAYGIGLAALASGVVLYFTAPKSRAHVTASPTVGSSYAGLSVSGVW